MLTLTSIAQELGLQTHELHAFLGLDRDFDVNAEVAEEDYIFILEAVEYDRQHNTMPESS